jgi:hypothetical protein
MSPQTNFVELQRGRLLLIRNQNRQAVEHFRALHDETPDPEHAGWYAASLAATDDIDGAVAMLERADGADTGFVVGQRLLIQALIRAGRHDEALARYERHATVAGIGDTFHSTRGSGVVADAYRDAVGSFEPNDDLVVFYHLPFSGGTSMQDAIHSVIPSSQRFRIRRRIGPTDIRAWNEVPADRTIRFLHHHHPYPVDANGRTRRYVTVVRDPAGRVVSGYFKRRAQERIVLTRDMDDEPTIEEHVDYLHRNGFVNLQTRNLAILHGRFRKRIPRRARKEWTLPTDDERYEDALPYIAATAHLRDDDLFELATSFLASPEVLAAGSVEQIDATALAVFAHWRLPLAPALPRLGGAKSREPVPPGVLERLREHNALDVRLHAWVRGTFRRRYPALVEAFEEAGATRDTAPVGALPIPAA